MLHKATAIGEIPVSILKIFLNLGAAALLAAPAVVALSALSGLGHRWPDILAQFTAPALAATVVLTVVLALLRLWPAAGLGGVVTVLLLVAVWPQVFPGGPKAVEGGPQLRVYSANLLARNRDVGAMRRSIEAADADILMLVEFGDAPNQAMETVLAGYPHRALSPRIDRPAGAVRSVIASRRPLQRLATPRDGLESIVVTADTAIGPVNLIATHLTRPWPYQYQWGQINQAQALADRIDDLEGPTILAGDFNSVSTGRIGRQVRAQNAMVAAPGWPGTWPAALPGPARITIDQVYHTRDIALVERRLGAPTGSDHRPVVTTFAPPDAD